MRICIASAPYLKALALVESDYRKRQQQALATTPPRNLLNGRYFSSSLKLLVRRNVQRSLPVVRSESVAGAYVHACV
jgi:hypothetical protein